MLAQLIYASVFITIGCAEQPLESNDLIGTYAYRALDTGAPHRAENLTLTAREACVTLNQAAPITKCTPWVLVRGENDMVVIDSRTFTVVKVRGRVRLVEDFDNDWFFAQVDR